MTSASSPTKMLPSLMPLRMMTAESVGISELVNRSMAPCPNPKAVLGLVSRTPRAAVERMIARLASCSGALVKAAMSGPKRKSVTTCAVWLNTNETPPSAQPFSERAQVAAATALPTIRRPTPTRAKVKAAEAASSAADDGRSTVITGGVSCAATSVHDSKRDRQRRRCRPR